MSTTRAEGTLGTWEETPELTQNPLEGLPLWTSLLPLIPGLFKQWKLDGRLYAGS